MRDLGEEEMVDDVGVGDIMVEVVEESAVAESEGVNQVLVGSVNGGDGSLEVVPALAAVVDDVSVSVLHVGDEVEPGNEDEVGDPVFLEEDGEGVGREEVDEPG